MSLPHNPQTDELFRSILLLRDLDDCYRYFEDLCTVKEIQAFSQRLEVAKRLHEDESYLAVTEQTGVSSATVGRVKRCLDYGAGGYQMILARLAEEEPGIQHPISIPTNASFTPCGSFTAAMGTYFIRSANLRSTTSTWKTKTFSIPVNF